MAGFHIDRISEDIKREIVSIMRELKDPRISDMLTVVKVDVSGDLSYAKVYISAMDGIDAAKMGCFWSNESRNALYLCIFRF